MMRDREQLRRWFNAQQVVAHGYMCCESVGEGLAIVRMDPPAALAAPNGGMNGGHLASLAENAGGLAAMSVYAEDVWAGAVHLELQFLEPVTEWPATASTRLVRGGKRLAFVTFEIHDATRRLCAQGSSISSLTTSTGWRCG
jgi:uncharacterized protein (TIGR00369 family)